MMSLEDLFRYYVENIIAQAEKGPLPLYVIQQNLDKCRHIIRCNLFTPEWWVMGYDSQLVSLLLRLGDDFFSKGNVKVAFNFFNEALCLFPYTAICHFKVAQCRHYMGDVKLAKKHSFAAIRCSEDTRVPLQDDCLTEIVQMLMDADELKDALRIAERILRKSPSNDVVQSKIREIKRKLEKKNEEKEDERKRKEEEKKSLAENRKKVEKRVGQKTPVPKIEKSSKERKKEEFAKQKKVDEEIKKKQEKDEKEKEREEGKKSKQTTKLPAKKTTTFPGYDVNVALEATRPKKRRSSRPELKNQRNERVVTPQLVHQLKSSLVGQPPSNPGKLSMDNIPASMDEHLSSGSVLRRICPKCRTPRVVKLQTKKCHICESELELFYRKVNTTTWTRPRKPPENVKPGKYTQCKHFQLGKRCARTPCTFAHGLDEVEIWELCRGKSRRRTRNKTMVATMQRSSSCMTLYDPSGSIGLRSRTQSQSSAYSLQFPSSSLSIASGPGDVSSLDDFESRSMTGSLSNELSQDTWDLNVFGPDECDSESITSSPAPDGGHSEIELAPTVVTDEETSPDLAADVPHAPTEDQSDDGWTTVSTKAKKKQSKPDSLKKKLKILCGYCRNVISSVDTPEAGRLLCNNCNRTEQPSYQYWDEKTERWCTLRSKPPGVTNVRICWHYTNHNEDHVMDNCKFAHGYYEKILWENQIKEGKSKKKKPAVPVHDNPPADSSCSSRDSVSLILNLEKLRCKFCDIRCSTSRELRRHNSEPQHKLAIAKKIIESEPGAAVASGPGTGLGSGPGAELRSGPGAVFASGPGTGLGSGPEAELGSGLGAAFASGTGVGSGPGAELGSGPGAAYASGPGAAYASGPGAAYASGPAAAYASGPGAAYASGPGAAYASGPGAGFGSGPEAGSGLRAGLAAWPGYGTGPRPGYGTGPGSEYGAWFGRGPVSSRACRPPPNGVYMGRYKLCHRFVNHGWCYLSDKCTFAHGTKEQEQWIEIYKRQSERISQLEKKELLVESFSQKIRRLEKEGRVVLKNNLPGVILNCSSEFRKELNKPQDHYWIFDVRINTTKRKLLNQVALLSEDHLDKFQLLQTSEESEQTIMRQSVELREDDFVEDSENHESAVQFCVKFKCRVFGEFEQKLVLDFGDEYLSRTLIASIMSDDVRDKQKKPGRSVCCQILEWSLENMELSLCPELIDDEGLRELYNIPCDLPEPATIEEFSRETYCKLWHDILFIEELYIQKEVARYDIRDGKMKLIREFQDSVDTAVYALPGELFGEISLEDYLVMDEASGHLFQRSVLSVIIRLKEEEKSERKKVYECLIKLKTAQSVIVQLNQELCEDHVLQNNSIVNIDLKVKYNRLPICEMHQAIDRCKEKTTCLLPLVKPASNRPTKSISTWYMAKKPNDNQQEAITLILDPSPAPPLLLYGPFGTGKTFTLNMACVEILNRSKTSKVLICTHSNSAADIHLDHLHTKLKKKRFIRPVRILNPTRNLRTIPVDLLQYCLLDGNTAREPTWNDLQPRNVIITTLASSRVLWKFFDAGKLRFTHILIDEAAQALEPECITPLSMASEETKIVLAGDHVQMGPLAYSKRLWVEGLGPSQSLLERLFALYKTSVSQQKSSGNVTEPTKPPHTVMLTENYRCHERILAFPSDCLYGKELVARGEQPLHPSFPALSFYTAQGRDKKLEGSLAYYNLAEVDEVAKRVEELFNLWPDCWGEPRMESIGVLSPYRDQVRMIRDALKRKRLRGVNVQTVENVQGQEFRALFISIVRTGWTCWEIEERNSEPEDLDFGFLSDIRLLNTAVTRAQSMLVVVGDPMSLCGLGACRDIWRDYLKRCHDDNGLYGCTLKTIMDSCLFSRVLDPCAQEFVPTEAHHKSSESETPTKELENPGDSLVIQEDRNDHSVENGAESKPTTMTNDKSVENGSTNVLQNSASTSADTPDGPHSDATAAENVDGANEEEGKEQTEEDFFSQIEAKEDFDEIIKALVQACKETKKKDEGMKIEETSNEEFPPLSDAATVSSAPPQWPRLQKTTPVFSAGMRNGRIELGFHVKASERLFRLTGGTSSFQPSEDRPCNDPQAYNHEELLALLEANPEIYSKCSFHVDFGGRQRRYFGQVPDPDSPDIYIPGRVRCTYEDDLVVVEKQNDVVLLNDDVQPLTGVIKGIFRTLIDPKERQFVCTVDRNHLGVMTPINKASPRLMNFTKTDEKDIIPIYKMNDRSQVTKAVVLRGKKVNEALAQERLFVVKFLQWRVNFPFPLGLAVRHLPSGRDFETGIEILYEEYNVKRKFSRKVLENCSQKFGNPEDWKLPAREKARPAYRSNVFTVDPPQSRDLDDAISVRVLDNGNYEVQIHIADVSYFVQPNTSLDDEAKSRGTSYYPPKLHDPVPMLPRELSEGCCSLLEGKDRLAVTLSVELSEDGMVIGEPKIERSVIRSCCRLTYHEAQEVIDEGMSKDGSFDGQGEVIEVQDGVEVNEQEVVVIEEPIKYDPDDEVETTDDETLMETKKAKRKKKKEKKKENSEVERDKREEMEKRRNDIKTREEMLNEAEKKDVAQAKNGETQEAEKRKKDIPRNVKEALLISHKLAVNLRKSRLGERSLYHRKDDEGDDEDTAAHELIAELMIMANHVVAKYLLKKYPQCTPLRVQPPPKMQRVKEWKSRFQKLERYSFGIKSFSNTEQEEEKELDIQVPSKTWNKIMSTLNLTADHDANLQEPTATRDTNSEELVKLVCDLDQYPQLALAYAHQQRLQQRASYTCSGEISATVPREDSATVPREDSATVPREDSATVPREDSATVPREDSETVPREDSATVPREDSATVPRGDSESVPRENSEDGSGDSETAPRDSETVPRGYSETIPREDPKTVSRGLSEIVLPGRSENILRGHSSLELDAYCHFTSPIRRYIDLVVHRLIVKSIEHDESQEADQQRPVYTTKDMTAICDRCTFLSRNSRRFDKDARKLQLAENLQNAMTFVNALIDEVERDNLKLFFGSKDLDSLRGQDKSVRIARLGPDHVSEPQGDQVTLEWILRLLKLDKQGRSQPVLEDEEEMSNTDSQTQVDEEEKHVEYNVPGDKWRGLLGAVKNDDHDLLKKRVQDLNELVQQQSPCTNSAKLSVLKKVENPPPESSSSSHENHASREPYQHPNIGNPEPDVKDTDEFYSVKKSLKSCDRVKVQLCPQVLRGMLTPNVQLFEITDKIHVCVEHRTYPTKCFAKVSSTYASRSEFSDIEQYLYLWKPVLMMEIATSAVRENDVFTLCNLRVTLSRDPSTKALTLEFALFKHYCETHELDVFDLNLMCVRIKDPRSRGTQAGFWVGHFQINESSEKKNKEKDEQVFEVKAQQVFEVKARLINSSSPIPQVLVDNKVCFVTAELICLSTPDRRRLGALTYIKRASELIQNICIGEVTVEEIEGNNLPRELSLANVDHSLPFRPLNAYQQRAVKEALSKAFTLIQGPPGTGKTVTGVHIAYWFAQMNEERMKKERMNSGKVNKERLSEEGEQEESNLAMVFYCGPSNKSVDVVGRYLKKIPGVKILRIYGQEIERKEFPVPDKLIVFREKRISSQLKADKELRDVSLHHVIRSNECPFADELKKRYDEIRNAAFGEVSRKMIYAYDEVKKAAEKWALTSNGVQIILCTCSAAYSPRLKPLLTAYCQCIVDECGMCIEAETLCAMVGSNAAQVVLIGDHKQLQPVIQCEKAKDLGLGISMFQRYSGWAQMLEIQYRMHHEICEFPSKYFYDGKLQTADQVRHRTTDEIDLWPKGTDFPFVFYHVVGKEESLVISTDQGNENSKRNRKEISKAVYLARELVRSGVSGDRIVVLSPYRAQCHEINEQLKQHGLKEISVMTVVAGQGSEKDYVILSLVRSLPDKEIEKNPPHSWLKQNLGFITDEHQINVALTRSRRGLCIVGNANLVGVCSIWKALLEHYDEKGCLVSDDPSLVPDLHRRR